jgi:hypothetical protein
MTAPPYEWPTNTTGPSIVPSKLETTAASPDRLRNGLGAAITG